MRCMISSSMEPTRNDGSERLICSWAQRPSTPWLRVLSAEKSPVLSERKEISSKPVFFRQSSSRPVMVSSDRSRTGR